MDRKMVVKKDQKKVVQEEIKLHHVGIQIKNKTI